MYQTGVLQKGKVRNEIKVMRVQSDLSVSVLLAYLHDLVSIGARRDLSCRFGNQREKRQSIFHIVKF